MFDRFKHFFAKESRAGRVIFGRSQQAEWSKRNYKAFADEGYSKNVIAYQAINKTAQAVAGVPWMLKDRQGNDIIDNPLLSLIERPNPLQSRVEFIHSVVGFYKISGNSYIERTLGSNGTPLELYALRSDRMSVKMSETGIPNLYKYKNGQDQVTWEADEITGQSDIRHLKTFNPLDDTYGLSPIEAGAYSIDQHNESMSWLQRLLQNSATPSGVLESKDDLSDEEYNRLKAELQEKFSGSENAGRPILLEGGMSWKQMGLSPQNMSILENKYSSARDISLAIGVPPLLLNIPGDSTYSNYKEARLAFYEESVVPLAEHIRDEMNVWLEPYLNGAKYELDFDRVPAIAEKRQQWWDMADKSTDLTINERRAIKGYDEVKNGDIIYINTSQIPLSFDAPQGESQDPEADGEEAFGNADTDGQ